ncbi:protein ROOT HAIR DEFECTIVE 3 homolog 1-like [Impatiens glandulifera]|uniref:protein ROOT HAIR DEFECTIVE 3 homolog 1-like n=1 Tax=Impatiens glandulifera TaxID=253017 RepID=UPI001FB11312|nr:protein ROOT HAIR DEFECTIVE 3 homolog 1-like [Impatiens glandulifera]
MAKTPLDKLSATLLNDTLEIWKEIPKPKDKQDAAFDNYFSVDELRKRFDSPPEASLQTKPLVPAIDFVRSTSKIWDSIIHDKALDIPSHKVMIAKVRCEQIGDDKFNAFIANEEWSQLKGAVNNSPPVSGFGIKVTSMVDKYLAEYDQEAEFYDEVIKADNREKLKQRLLQEIKPTFGSLMDNISSQALNDFKFNLDKDLNEGKKFREAADWSKMLEKFDSDYEDSRIQHAEKTTKVRDKLVSQISSHVDSIRSMKQNELTSQVNSRLKSGLRESMGAILKKPESNMWDNLNDLFQNETETACSVLRDGLEDLGTNDNAKVEENELLKAYGRNIIEKSVREETYKILQHMQDKFCYILLNEPNSSIPRSWKGSDVIEDIVKNARTQCVSIMSAMAIIRLGINKESDNIQQILSNALLDGGGEGRLTSSRWDGVEPSKTLMSPASCATVWDHFLDSSGIIITCVKQTIQARNDADNATAANNQPQQQENHQSNIGLALAESALRMALPVHALVFDVVGKLVK